MWQRLAWMAGMLAMTSCATPMTSDSCVDIGGSYRNLGEPGDVSLATLLLETKASAQKVTISSQTGTRDLVVVADRERRILRYNSDFTCTQAGIELTQPIRTESALPPLASASETTRFTLTKSAEGHLLGHRLVKTRATAYGIPLSGPTHTAPDVIWGR